MKHLEGYPWTAHIMDVQVITLYYRLYCMFMCNTKINLYMLDAP